MEHAGRTSHFGVVRAEIGQLIIGAIVISLGSGIFSSGVFSYFSGNIFWITSFGFLLILIGLAIAVWRVLPVTKGTLHINAPIVTDRESGLPIRIEGYEFSENIAQYVKGLMVENKALARTWSKDFFSFSSPVDGKSQVSRNESANLAVEAIEYFILDKLSTHLTDYFNKSEFDEGNKLIVFERDNVHELFTKNRFLDLFSRPMNEREAFSDHVSGGGGEVVFAYGPGGALYDRFKLVLPRGAKISRLGHGHFSVATKRFQMSVRCSLSFSHFNLPRQFSEKYIGMEYEDIKSNSAEIVIDVKFSFWHIFSESGIEYYRWVDNFLDRVGKSSRFKNFINEIGWKTAGTISHLEGMQKIGLSKPKSSTSTRGSKVS